MDNMIKFYRGLVGNLPETGVNGALYITTDEGAIYYGTGTGMKRLGDFVQVANVAALPEKAHESCLYYCVAENILAKWNGTEWKQINKQPTAEELKGLLGLGSLAYKSEVAEGDLNSALKEKINTVAQGNHSHSNKDLLDTYTQTEANLADAVAKKHAHTFNETELNKIVEGDVAKWNGVAADHLTSADKTTLENAIKEAKKAGTDANTNIETYKVSNDARVKAVEDDIAEITDGTNGILAQAKSYSDGKLATARTEISAEIDGDVKVVSDALDAYKTSNNEALAGVKATAEAAAVKTEVESALAGKVDKVEGKSLISDSEIARLANVTNYDDTQVKADIAKKADAEATTNALNGKVDKATGYSLVSDTEIERLSKVDNYDDEEVRGLIADRYTKEEADGKFALIADAYDDTELAGRVKAIEDDYLVEADKTELTNAINAKVAQSDYDVKVKALEDAIATKQDIIPENTYDAYGAAATAESNAKGYVDSKFEEANLAQYTTEQEVKDIVDAVVAGAVDGDTITGLANLVEYINTHGGEAAEMAGAIDVLEGKVETIEGKPAYGILSTDITAWNNEIGAKELAESKTTTAEVKTQIEAYGYATEADLTLAEGRIATLEAIDHEAYKGYADDKASAAQSAAEATAAGALASAKSELEGKITDGDAAVEAKVTALADNTYTKEQTFTKEEVNAAIAAAVEAAHTWGEF